MAFKRSTKKYVPEPEEELDENGHDDHDEPEDEEENGGRRDSRRDRSSDKGGRKRSRFGDLEIGALFATKKEGFFVGTIKNRGEYENFSNLAELVADADPEVGITLFVRENRKGGSPAYFISAALSDGR